MNEKHILGAVVIVLLMLVVYIMISYHNNKECFYTGSGYSTEKVKDMFSYCETLDKCVPVKTPEPYTTLEQSNLVWFMNEYSITCNPGELIVGLEYSAVYPKYNENTRAVFITALYTRKIEDILKLADPEHGHYVRILEKYTIDSPKSAEHAIPDMFGNDIIIEAQGAIRETWFCNKGCALSGFLQTGFNAIKAPSGSPFVFVQTGFMVAQINVANPDMAVADKFYSLDGPEIPFKTKFGSDKTFMKSMTFQILGMKSQDDKNGMTLCYPSGITTATKEALNNEMSCLNSLTDTCLDSMTGEAKTYLINNFCGKPENVNTEQGKKLCGTSGGGTGGGGTGGGTGGDGGGGTTGTSGNDTKTSSSLLIVIAVITVIALGVFVYKRK